LHANPIVQKNIIGSIESLALEREAHPPSGTQMHRQGSFPPLTTHLVAWWASRRVASWKE
jgi:hypothetical protein